MPRRPKVEAHGVDQQVPVPAGLASRRAAAWQPSPEQGWSSRTQLERATKPAAATADTLEVLKWPGVLTHSQSAAQVGAGTPSVPAWPAARRCNCSGRAGRTGRSSPSAKEPQRKQPNPAVTATLRILSAAILGKASQNSRCGEQQRGHCSNRWAGIRSGLEGTGLKSTAPPYRQHSEGPEPATAQRQQDPTKTPSPRPPKQQRMFWRSHKQAPERWPSALRVLKSNAWPPER